MVALAALAAQGALWSSNTASSQSKAPCCVPPTIETCQRFRPGRCPVSHKVTMRSASARRILPRPAHGSSSLLSALAIVVFQDCAVWATSPAPHQASSSRTASACHRLTPLLAASHNGASAAQRAVSSAVEHTLHTRGVTGSIPVPPTILQMRLIVLRFRLRARPRAFARSLPLRLAAAPRRPSR